MDQDTSVQYRSLAAAIKDKSTLELDRGQKHELAEKSLQTVQYSPRIIPEEFLNYRLRPFLDQAEYEYHPGGQLPTLRDSDP